MQRSLVHTGATIVIASMLAVAALSGIALAQAYESEIAQYEPGDQGNVTASLGMWENQIRAYGGKKAFDRFSYAVANLTEGQKHAYAHVFGQALYEVEGMEGFDACDTRFQSGCLHQFIAEALNRQGIGIADEFGSRCAELEKAQMPGCSHGIGHALIAWFGYDRAGLDATLAVCDRFDPMQRAGCLDGAFMEYHLRDVSVGGDEEARFSRSMNDTDRYEPCLSVGDTYRKACMRELPHWWFVSLSDTDIDKRVALMGRWCRDLGEPSQENCIRGIGFLLPAVVSENSEYRRLCDQVGDNADVVNCYLGVARRRSMDHPAEKLICGALGLHAQEKIGCETYAIIKK